MKKRTDVLSIVFSILIIAVSVYLIVITDVVFEDSSAMQPLKWIMPATPLIGGVLPVILAIGYHSDAGDYWKQRIAWVVIITILEYLVWELMCNYGVGVFHLGIFLIPFLIPYVISVIYFFGMAKSKKEGLTVFLSNPGNYFLLWMLGFLWYIYNTSWD